MSAQVVEHAGVAQQARVHPPGGLRMALFFQQRRGPSRGVLRLNDFYLPQIAVSDHARRMAYHCVAGVVVRQAKEQFALFGKGFQLLGFPD